MPDTNNDHYGKWSYAMAWCRCQPYIVGAVVGFACFKTRGHRVKLDKVRPMEKIVKLAQ